MRLKRKVRQWFSGVLLYWCLSKLFPLTLGTCFLTCSFVPCSETSFSHQDSLCISFLFSEHKVIVNLCSCPDTQLALSFSASCLVISNHCERYRKSFWKITEFSKMHLDNFIWLYNLLCSFSYPWQWILTLITIQTPAASYSADISSIQRNHQVFNTLQRQSVAFSRVLGPGLILLVEIKVCLWSLPFQTPSRAPNYRLVKSYS